MDAPTPMEPTPRGSRKILPGMLVLALVLTVAIPTLAQQATSPLEETVSTACINPGLQAGPSRGPVDQRPSGVHGGCQVWNHDTSTSAVEGIRDHDHVLAAGVENDRLTVTRLNATTGDTLWETQAPARNGEEITILLDEEHEAAYLGWHTYPHRWQNAMTRSPHETTFEPGGIAKIDLEDGTLVWQRTPGSAGIALSPDGDRLYHAATTQGLHLEHTARLETTSLDTETGTPAWTNSSSLWWDAHAPLFALDATEEPFCDAGPADLEVHPNGTLFVARSQACNLLPGALLGYAPNGTLTHAWTYPVPLGEHDADPLPITETSLALHPAGHILYAVSTHHVAAYHTLTRDQLWAWTSTDPVDCQQPPCNAPEGPGLWHSDGFPGGLDAATTPSGDLIISAFDDGLLHGHDIVPRLLTLDGTTGEPLHREPPELGPNTKIHLHHPDSTIDPGRYGSPLASEISLEPHGLFAFVSYQAGSQGRVLGFPLAGDTAGPAWEAFGPHEAEDTWTIEDSTVLDRPRGVASTTETVVVAGASTTGHAKGRILEALTETPRPNHITLQDEATTDAHRALTGAVHGARIVEGTPTLHVRTSDSIRAHVNVTEPGTYYLLVDGLDAGDRYALHAPHDPNQPTPAPAGSACTPHALTQPHVHPFLFDLATNTVDDTNDPCQRSDPGLCTSDTRNPVVESPRYLEDNCWTTGERGPVTVTRADREDDEEAEQGSALFGPLIITEGEYAIVRAPPLDPLSPGPSVAAIQDAAHGCGAEDLFSLGGNPQGHHGLEVCIEVRFETGEDALPPVPPQTSSSSSGGTWGQHCAYEVDHVAAVSTAETEPRTGKAEGRILQSSVNMIGLGIERYPQGSGSCGIHAGYAQSVATFYLNGSTEFRGTTEWRAAFNLACLVGWDQGGCKDSSSSASIQLRKPSSCIPDEEGIYVHELPGPPGTTGAERERNGFLTEIAKRIVHEITGQPLFWAIERTHEGLKLAQDHFFEKDCEREAMAACGLGCQEWAWSVSGNEQFLHRLNMRAAQCATIEYPVTWGIEKGILRFDTEYGVIAAWTLPGAFVDQSFPVILEEC